MSEGKKVEGDGRTAVEKALSNDLVMERILSQVEFKDKKNIRVLSKFCRDSTLADWRKSAALRINISNEVPQVNQSQGLEMLAWNDFEEIMEDPEWSDLSLFRIQDKPFRRVILLGNMWLPLDWENVEGVKAAEVDSVVQSRLAQFLNEYGPTLQYLRLEGVSIAPGCCLPGLKWLLRKACPQLRGLSLQVRKYYHPFEPSKIDYSAAGEDDVSHLEMSLARLQISPEEVASNLTHLDILIENDDVYNGMYALDMRFWDRDQINVNEILRFVPNLKVLKLRESERHVGNTNPTPIIGVEIFRDPLEKEKCSALEELGLLVFRIRFSGRTREDKEMGIEELNRYMEEVNPSLKRIQIEVDFDRRIEDNEGIECPYPDFHQFCIQSGHLLTELTINVRKLHGVRIDTYWNLYADPNSPDKPDEEYRYGDYNRGEWVNYLTGYSFPNLTKLTYTFDFYCEDCNFDAGYSPFFDFSTLNEMPKLKTFRCIDMTGPRVYLNLHPFGKNPHPFRHKITNRHLADAKRTYFWTKREGELEEGVPDSLRLENLEEFVYDSVKDGFTVDSLKTVLGLMKRVKKLKLCLDEITFPVVLEMIPDLEELTLIGNYVDLTELEMETGIVWMDKDELIIKRRKANERREKVSTPSPVNTKEYIAQDVDEFAIFGALRTRKKLRIFNIGCDEAYKLEYKPCLIEYRLK